MATTLDPLAEQLRQQWGGDWNIQGVDRAAELASLFRQNGITSLDGLNASLQPYDIRQNLLTAHDRPQDGYNVTGVTDPFGHTYGVQRDGNGEVVYGADGKPAFADGTQLDPYKGLSFNGGAGYLGSINNGGSLNPALAGPRLGLNTDPNSFEIGKSMQGHGQVGFYAMPDGKGGFIYRPTWNSSSDAELGRDAAKVAAFIAGGAYLGGAFGAGEAGAAGTAGAGLTEGAAPTLGSVGSDVTALGSSWSPQGLGLSGGITPGVSASELSALNGALPGAVGGGSFTDALVNGAIKGGIKGGITSGLQGRNPFTGALTGAVGGAIGGGIGSTVNDFNPGGSPIVNGALSGGLTTGLLGGNPITGAVSGGLSGAGSQFGNQQTTPPSTGGKMDFGDFFGGDGGDTNYTGNALWFTPGATDSGPSWNPDMPDWGNVFLNNAGSGGSWLDALGSGAKSFLGGLGNAVGGNQNLGAILGALAGAASSKSGNTTVSHAPWEAAQPYLKSVLGDADKLRQQFNANPFTPQQTQAYQQAFGGLDQARAQLPGLLSFGQSAMNGAYSNSLPSFQGLLAGVNPAMRSPAGYQDPSPSLLPPTVKLPLNPTPNGRK